MRINKRMELISNIDNGIGISEFLSIPITNPENLLKTEMINLMP